MKATIQQISGNNQKGKPILSLIVKRTYNIQDDGNCVLSDDQIPLNRDVEFHKENEDTILHDIDVYPVKPFTDIVVKGKAKNPRNTNLFNASVEIASLKLEMQITGNRKVHKRENGVLTFSEAELINEVPLEYKFAYGGKDLFAEKPLREKIENEESLKYIKEILDPLSGSPYRYPRNPVGRGFMVEPHPETVEALNLPNIEDPYNLLTPENLICKDVDQWYKMPVPTCTDWVSPGWFPRVAYFGVYPLPQGLNEHIYEIKNKWADLDLLKSTADIKNSQFSFRACNGASLGLQSRYLYGGESCRLTNIHPEKQEFVFQLPKEIPTIKVDGRNGKLLKTTPVMHSIIIEPDMKKLSIVWCGSAKAIRPYFEEELKTMPFEVKWK